MKRSSWFNKGEFSEFALIFFILGLIGWHVWDSYVESGRLTLRILFDIFGFTLFILMCIFAYSFNGLNSSADIYTTPLSKLKHDNKTDHLHEFSKKKEGISHSIYSDFIYKTFFYIAQISMVIYAMILFALFLASDFTFSFMVGALLSIPLLIVLYGYYYQSARRGESKSFKEGVVHLLMNKKK